MSVLRLGLGGALLLTLGFGSAPAPVEVGGSYVTLGQGQSASKFAMLGLSSANVIPVEFGGGGSVGIRVSPSSRLRLQRDDELIAFIASAAAALGLLE